MKPYQFLITLTAVLINLGCSQPAEKQNIFLHDLGDGPAPWSSAPSGRTDSSFTFAIISDLNGGERDGIFKVAVEQINLLRPEFILSVGDLVDGGTEDVSEMKKQYDSFDERVNKAKAPFFHVGGNHDLTSASMRKYWDERYGRKYYHFIYQNVLFLLLDTDDYSPAFRKKISIARFEAVYGDSSSNFEATYYYRMPERKSGKLGEEQLAYFEKVIANNPGVRHTFILMHKPVWQREGEGNLSRIETALGSSDYTVINGHFHSYSHTVKNGHDYMMLGTTGGAQNAEDKNSFDHISLVSFSNDGPSIATIRLDGILDKTGNIPLEGDQYCYQASTCKGDGR